MAKYTVKTIETPSQNIVEVWWKDNHSGETGHYVLSTAEYEKTFKQVLDEEAENITPNEDPEVQSAVKNEFDSRNPEHANTFYDPEQIKIVQEDPPADDGGSTTGPNGEIYQQ